MESQIRQRPSHDQYQIPIRENDFEVKYEPTLDLDFAALLDADLKNSPDDAGLSLEFTETKSSQTDDLEKTHQNEDGLKQKLSDYASQLQSCMDRVKDITSRMEQLIVEKNQLEVEAKASIMTVEDVCKKNEELNAELEQWKEKADDMKRLALKLKKKYEECKAFKELFNESWNNCEVISKQFSELSAEHRRQQSHSKWNNVLAFITTVFLVLATLFGTKGLLDG